MGQGPSKRYPHEIHNGDIIFDSQIYKLGNLYGRIDTSNDERHKHTSPSKFLDDVKTFTSAVLLYSCTNKVYPTIDSNNCFNRMLRDIRNYCEQLCDGKMKYFFVKENADALLELMQYMQASLDKSTHSELCIKILLSKLKILEHLIVREPCTFRDSERKAIDSYLESTIKIIDETKLDGTKQEFFTNITKRCRILKGRFESPVIKMTFEEMSVELTYTKIDLDESNIIGLEKYIMAVLTDKAPPPEEYYQIKDKKD